MELSKCKQQVWKSKDDNDVAVTGCESITTLLTLLAPFAPADLSQNSLAQFGIELTSTSFPSGRRICVDTQHEKPSWFKLTASFAVSLEVAVDDYKDDILAQGQKHLPEVQQFLTGPTKKEIVVPNKLVNLVV